jgi:hypothetical protein
MSVIKMAVINSVMTDSIVLQKKTKKNKIERTFFFLKKYIAWHYDSGF